MNSSFITDVSNQLRRNDLSQLLAGFLTLLIFVLIVTWPDPERANDSWYALAQTRLVVLLLMGLQLGGLSYRQPLGQRLATLLALNVFLLLSLPLDLASYATGFPSVPWLWALAVTWVDLLAYFVLGFLVARLLGRLGHSLVLAVTLLAIFIASFFADLLLGYHVFHPLVALTSVSPLHLTLMTLVALLGGWQLIRSRQAVVETAEVS